MFTSYCLFLHLYLHFDTLFLVCFTIKYLQILLPNQIIVLPPFHAALSVPSLCIISGYIEEFEIVDDHRAGKVVVNLTGRINKCGVISPRFDLPITQIEKWTNSLLPSRQFG